MQNDLGPSIHGDRIDQSEAGCPCSIHPRDAHRPGEGGGATQGHTQQQRQRQHLYLWVLLQPSLAVIACPVSVPPTPFLLRPAAEGAGLQDMVAEMEAQGKEVPRDAFGHVRFDTVNPGKYFAETCKSSGFPHCYSPLLPNPAQPSPRRSFHPPLPTASCLSHTLLLHFHFRQTSLFTRLPFSLAAGLPVPFAPQSAL